MLLETCTHDSHTSEFMAARNHYAEYTYLIDIFRYYTVITTFGLWLARYFTSSCLSTVFSYFVFTYFIFTSILSYDDSTFNSVLYNVTQWCWTSKGIRKIVNSSRLRATEYSGTIYIDCINYLWPHSFTSVWLP